MRPLLGTITDRGYGMIGLGIGLGASGFVLRSPFSPASISGLSLWLDGADPSTLYQSNGGSLAAADGDPVGYWMDKSGNARHAEQASGTNKPARKLAIQNGQSAVLFDGVNDSMTLASSVSNQPISFFVVFKKINVASPESALLGGGGTPFYPLDVTATDAYWFAGTLAASGLTLNNLTKLYCVTGSSTSKNMYLNAASVATSGAGYATTNPFTTIGNWLPGGTSWASGHICEMLVYNSVLSVANIATVNSYLNGKWGIY
jgi:hypothetical protein